MLNVTPLSDLIGVCINAAEGQRVSDLDLEEVKNLYKQHGTIVFRGFDTEVDEFEAFTDHFGPSPKGMHNVYEGHQWLAPHGELTWMPTPPEIIFFYSIKPASSGGETTVVDGIKILERLSPETVALFRAKRLRFHRVRPVAEWRELTDDPEKAALLDGATLEGVQVQFDAEGNLHRYYTTSAIRKTKFGNQDAFVNVIQHAMGGTARLKQMYGLTLEDETPIPQEVLDEIVRVVMPMTVPIAWNAKDFAMIDNTRVMHGRNAYTDLTRALRTKQSLATF